MADESATKTGDRAAGLSLVAAAGLTILAMSHHPSSHAEGGLTALVHGVMIVLVATLLFGFTQFARRQGLRQPLVLAGLVAYGVGVGVNVLAATINGFVAPALAGSDVGVGDDVFRFAWELNQALARLGVVATGVAFVLWSLHLLASSSPAGSPWGRRIVAVLGVVAGIAPVAGLAAGSGTMNVPTAFAIYASHAAWSAIVGVQMFRGRL